MSTFGFVQARMGSTRLPGKVLEPLAGRPAVARVLERVARAPGIDGVALLTSDTPGDEPLRRFGEELGVPVVAGSHEDVLDRFQLAATRLGAETIVRVTADCPLVDAEVLGELVELYADAPGLDYAGIATGAVAARAGLCRYPDGLDGEIFSAAALARAWERASDPYEREHVTPFMWRKPENFELGLLQAPEDLGEERWTIDHASDLAFVRAVYERLAEREPFGYRDVLDLLAREQALRGINAAERDGAAPARQDQPR
ncbi:MAG TPA: glycosyltransferase family protein [Solirubrobacteraceae bacterium]|jgi:spore coat polysaccharide biosynthesis protein SpsF (cytidylyltransferase family)